MLLPPPRSTLFPYTTLFRSASLTLAADYCPKRSEGFTFAALMSITNLASALADNVGALLYQHVFSSRLSPLRSEEHTSELQSLRHLVCRLLLEKKKKKKSNN